MTWIPPTPWAGVSAGAATDVHGRSPTRTPSLTRNRNRPRSAVVERAIDAGLRTEPAQLGEVVLDGPVGASTGPPRPLVPTAPRWRCHGGRRAGCSGTSPSPPPATTVLLGTVRQGRSISRSPASDGPIPHRGWRRRRRWSRRPPARRTSRGTSTTRMYPSSMPWGLERDGRRPVPGTPRTPRRRTRCPRHRAIRVSSSAAYPTSSASSRRAVRLGRLAGHVAVPAGSSNSQRSTAGRYWCTRTTESSSVTRRRPPRRDGARCPVRTADPPGRRTRP